MRFDLRAIFIGVVAILAAGECAPAAATPPPADARPVVIVFSRSIGGTTCGNGFVVGDGTWIVTARHVVYPTRLRGLHQGEAFVTILSPYLGDACEADVVAQDPELDLIVLRGPWRGHPSYHVADEADVVAAEAIELRAVTAAVTAVVAGKPQLLGESVEGDATTLPISSVAVLKSVTRKVITETAPAGASWAGAAMVLPGTASVAGCFGRTQADGSMGVGAAAGAIRALIDQARTARDINSTPPALVAAANSAAATRLYLAGVAASAGRDWDGAYANFRHFLELRPNSAIGYRDAAGQAVGARREDEAQRLYAKALELAPSCVSARVLYGQLLDERILPTAALQHLRYAWTNGRGSTAAVIPLCNILRRQNHEDQCRSLLEEAVKRRPLDAHLWTYLGQSRISLRDTAGGAAALARAAELMPENEPQFVQAGDAFAAAGDQRRAEEQYRALVREHPDSAAAHYFLAKYLASGSANRDESRQEAQRALALPATPGGPPRGAIEALIASIRSPQATPNKPFSLDD